MVMVLPFLPTMSRQLAVSRVFTLIRRPIKARSLGSSKQRTKKITVACNFCRCESQELFWKMIGTEPIVPQLVNSNAMVDVLPAVSVSSDPTPVIICRRPASGAPHIDARKTRASLKAARRRDRRMRTIRQSLPMCPPNRCRGGAPTSRSVRFWRASRKLWLGRPSLGNHSRSSRRPSGRNTSLLDLRLRMDVPCSRITSCRILPHSHFLKVPRQQR